MPKWTSEQQDAIYKKGTNIIVSAGAGSGKTAVLSERVLEHVKSGISIDDLLVLTFTNAAAAEMKDRIRSKIRKVPELKEELDKVDLAYITTFDSFALSLVKKYSYLMNISKNINIIDASIMTLKKEEELNNIFEELYQERNLSFLKLISDFTVKDDKEIFNAVLGLYAKLDNRYDKDTILNSYLDSYYSDDNISKLVNDYMALIKMRLEVLNNTVDNLYHYTDDTFQGKMEEVIRPLISAVDYLDIKRLCVIKLPVLRGADEVTKKIKDEVKSIVDEIGDLTKYNSLDEIKESLYLTKDYVEIIIAIIQKLGKRLDKFKKDNNAYDFIDIAKMAINILKNNDAVRCEMKYKYKEILIDEYQDTNDIQDIFISLIENNNVYMVGDIKQSIYRFRNANPLLFKSKYEAYQNNDGGLKIDLNKNFRSRSEVLNNINMMFNLFMDNFIGGADYIQSHQMVFGLTPYNDVNKENYNMDVLNYTYDKDSKFTKEEIEIFTVARDIKEKIANGYEMMDKETMQRRPVNYGDFVILMDRSSSFNLYKKIFEYLNIPITIYRDKTISDSVDISIIKNIYNLLVLIKRRDFGTMFSYSFMAVARSYLFNMSDKDILKVISNRSYAETEIYAILYELAKELDNMPNNEVFRLIIERFKFQEAFITTGDVKEHLVTIDSISKIADNATNFGYSPYEFLDYLNMVYEEGLDIKLSLNKEASNSVKIMTIHASKGLEYPVCYFTGLFKKFNIDDLKNKFYYDNTLGFITPYVKNGIHSTVVKLMLKNKYILEEISERLRLFYVALTRAREKMIIVGEFDKNELAYKVEGVVDRETRSSYRKFTDMLNSIYDYLKPYIKDIDIDSLGLTKDYNLSVKKDLETLKSEKGGIIAVDEYIHDSKKIENSHFSKVTSTLRSKEEQKNIDFGLRMHYLFEITDFSNPDYKDFNAFEVNCIEKFINTGILNDSKEIYKEYEFIYNNCDRENHGIIDLLIIKRDKAIIVDYKLKHTTDVAYLEQLKGYKNYILEMTNLPVFCYLYSIMDSNLVDLNI